MKNRETLRQLVINAVYVHPEGVNHVQLVRFILETGYRHPGSLSADLMQVVRILTKHGVLEKTLRPGKSNPQVANNVRCSKGLTSFVV